jgi:hypothetical protein
MSFFGPETLHEEPPGAIADTFSKKHQDKLSRPHSHTPVSLITGGQKYRKQKSETNKVQSAKDSSQT